MGNAQAFVNLDEHLEHLRKLVTITDDVVEEVRDALKAKTAANIAAQVDPYGHAWFPSKSGEPVLTNAMGAITFTVKGSTVVLEVSGVEAMHHIGTARGYHGGSAKKGGFRRPLIPWSNLPGPYKAVIREVLQKRFDQIFTSRAA